MILYIMSIPKISFFIPVNSTGFEPGTGQGVKRMKSQPHQENAMQENAMKNPTLPEPEQAATRAFTLIELLVVITIIALLASLTLSAIGRALDRGKRTACASNLRQIGQSIYLYAAENREWLPLNRESSGPTWSRELIDSGFSEAGGAWRCPSHKPSPDTEALEVRSYIINGWITGPWGAASASRQRLFEAGEKYGPSLRGLVTEQWRGSGEGGAPRDNTHGEFQENLNYLLWPWNVRGPHRGDHANMLFLDGHVETVRYDFAKRGERNFTDIYDRVRWRWL